MDPNRNLLWCRALAEELARSGVREVCVAPGSRSAPLAIALADQPELRIHVHLDERCAGFFALGLARTSGRPAAVLCTSGTAAANLLPAVVEAWHARVPLVVLTADRPPELHSCAAPQTIDQMKLYGSHALEFAELPLPEPEPRLLRALRATACRLVERSLGLPAGPVHLNVPLRDPLDPRSVPGDVPADLAERDPAAFRGRPGGPFVRATRADPTGAGPALERLIELCSNAGRGLIVAGPLLPMTGLREAILGLGRATGYPILADPLSQLRAGAPPGSAVLGAYDAFLRSHRLVAELQPELVLRFGAPPTSKSLTQALQTWSAAGQVLVDPAPGLADPTHAGVEVLRADPATLSRIAASRLRTPPADLKFSAALLRAEALAREALAAAAREAWFEAGVVRGLAEALPAGSLLFAGNSLPVRELDTFLPVSERPLEIHANRGANGIDGVVSTALGALAGAGPGRRGALLIGDVSLVHDMGGLLQARREGIPLVIVVLHNDGGAIFSYLPVRDQTPHFEALFTTPHGLEFEPLARLFGLSYARTQGPEFQEAFTRAADSGGPSLIEVRLERERSVRLHRAAWDAAVRSVEES
jgi:2-succinyl-5-enolpyruvyl-6-hydroxy-3-cyclohexene-1-carboxylate synthase